MSNSGQRTVVYRGFDSIEVEMVEAQLRAAGLPCVRTGRANAALLGAGNYIVEQSIEVPLARAAEAQALLSRASITLVGDLEQAAMNAAPAEGPLLGVPVDAASTRMVTRAVMLLLFTCMLYLLAVFLLR